MTVARISKRLFNTAVEQLLIATVKAKDERGLLLGCVVKNPELLITRITQEIERQGDVRVELVDD